ncbi:F-box domain protein [Acinetobacter phage vB_AbaM_ME3]|uniref:F-box domain protein n=1 Tax=Acinetobacter phage vB_AbaM_ME3 TaxID=1837876 RepID=A0A172Q0P4_9CAUD|nr:F-box domain protein [Acinetobacter phage vB_AbaM_ME3]AND75426.1 F-box domain protein [Acinetobacter phage vB_AbaM_ME3]
MTEFTFVQTCTACPEQYEVFSNGIQVGYLRLRHGHFRVDYPDCGGETIYSANTKGDGYFEDDERGFFLEEATKAIKAKLLSIEQEITFDDQD